MAKKRRKKTPDQNETGQLSQLVKPIPIAVGVVALAVLGYLAYYFLLGGSGPSYKSELLDFKKHGELTFLAADGTSGTSVDIEIVEDTQKARAGLMYRHQLGESQGMLFIFPEQDIRSFWMRTTYVPLDLIFVDTSLEIVSIVKNTVPQSEERYHSGHPAMYVLEVNAGFTDKHGIQEGYRVEWSKLQ